MGDGAPVQAEAEQANQAEAGQAGTDAEGSRSPRRILYCRAPGLLARAARQEKNAAENAPLAESAPLAVSAGKTIRDADPFALARGIHAGQAVAQARRLCPPLLVVALETVQHKDLTGRLLDLLADLSPAVEPDGPDAAYLDVTGSVPDLHVLERRVRGLTDFSPLAGVGPSRLAARACAECGLPPERLGEADAAWLWPEDAKVVGRLRRLGLDTFGQVAALREEDLFYQFGKIGRLLHRRAHGQDLTAVLALYPPPRADFHLDFAEFPLSDRAMLQAALATAAHEASGQLRGLGRFGRRVVLCISVEGNGPRAEDVRREWTVPAPLQDAPALTRAAGRLLMGMTITAPVTSLRLLVEDLETPRAATPDLFAGRLHGDAVALEAARRLLAERYGPQALIPLSRRPQSVREQRRALDREARA